MSTLTILTGRAHSGKTAALHRALSAHMRRGERAVLIVPEQYTFEAERALSRENGGLLGIEALSVERLCERVLDEGGHLPYLSEQGLSMVVRRAAAKRGETLSAFSRAVRQTGFSAELRALFSEMKQAGVTPELLKAALEKLGDGTLLREKLSDVALLYGDTEAFLHGRYLSAHDRMDAVCSLLPGSLIAGVPVYFDGFPAPTAQLFSFFEALLGCAGDVTVALCVSDAGDADAPLFAPERMVARRLAAIGEKLGVPVRTAALMQEGGGAPALRHLERNLHAHPETVFSAPAQAVGVYAASGRTAEAEALADAVCEAVRGGCRYREIAVLLSDAEAYGALLERSFRLRGIPYFLDAKRPVSSHAAAALLTGALDCVTDGFQPEDVTLLSKCGYARVSDEDAAALENYVLRCGIRGTGFFAPFTRGEPEEGAERARSILLPPLLVLREALHGKTVQEKLTAAYAYLTAMELPEQLKARAEALEQGGRVTLAEEHAQLWEKLTALFDQTAAVLGPVQMSRAEFRDVLAEGLSESAIGVIPDTADRVLLGTVGRTRLPEVRVLLLAGCNEGLLPKDRFDDALIDDAELKTLADCGLPVWNDTAFGTALDRLRLYESLAAARERIEFFYSLSGGDGELTVSPVVSRVRALLPNCTQRSGLLGSDALPVCARTGLPLLARALRQSAAEGKETALCGALLDYYANEPAYAARAAALQGASLGRVSPAPLSPALTRALYGARVTMSPSRLEQFSACPFRQFAAHGLGAKERREFTERAADEGSFFHAALEAFLSGCALRGADVGRLSEAETDAILDAVLPGVIAAHNGGIFLHSERHRATLFLLVATVRQSAQAIVRQLAAGGFRPLGAEVRFGRGQAFPPIVLPLPDGGAVELSGVIDRVDAAECAGERFLRVIDYKTGGRKLEFGSVLAGLTLQLPLYLLAATAADSVPAGLYYMPVRVPPVADAEEIGQALAERFRLQGLTVDVDAAVTLTDAGMERGSSVLSGVRRNRDGTLSGAVVSGAQMRGFLEKAREVAGDAAARMLGGSAEVSPAERACTYCPFRSVCRFDPRMPACRVRRRDAVSRKAFFDMIGGTPDAVD